MSKAPGIFLSFLLVTFFVAANAQRHDSLLSEATLQQCVQYALAHQPTIKQHEIDEEIADAYIKTKLADWYPQLNLDYNFQHYFQLQKTVSNGSVIPLGVQNVSSLDLGLTQTIFNPDVLLASRTGNNVRKEVKQFGISNKIYVVLNVSKAFYDVLLTQQQIILVNDDIVRLDRSVKDAFNQYKAGIVDKTDYKRAQISLNNSQAQKKQYEELATAKFAYLKLLMGYPQQASFNLSYDSLQLHNEIYIDTLQQVDYNNRIEYQLLQTEKNLLEANVKYYKWSYLPSLSAFANYNLNYFNNNFSKLYSQNFPSSYAGLTISFPIFQGGKRIQQIRGATLQIKRLEYNFITLRDSIQTEYTEALTSYKTYLNDYFVQRENLDLATDVYNTIQLQYKAGIKTYLDVIIAESDLRTTQVNYLNALYRTLSSKLDVEKAMGVLTY
jgi:outer membrane protein TolC